MKTIVEYAQRLVYSLLSLMPSMYQKASLNALFGLFLEAQGHPLPQHIQVKSASSLSRFLNHYLWSTRSVIRTTRQAVMEQISHHPPHPNTPLRVLIDLTSLDSCGKFFQLSTPTDNPDAPDPWVRMLNGKRGLHKARVGSGHWGVARAVELSGLARLGASQSCAAGVQVIGHRSPSAQSRQGGASAG